MRRHQPRMRRHHPRVRQYWRRLWESFRWHRHRRCRLPTGPLSRPNPEDSAVGTWVQAWLCRIRLLPLLLPLVLPLLLLPQLPHPGAARPHARSRGSARDPDPDRDRGGAPDRGAARDRSEMTAHVRTEDVTIAAAKTEAVKTEAAMTEAATIEVGTVLEVGMTEAAATIEVGMIVAAVMIGAETIAGTIAAMTGAMTAVVMTAVATIVVAEMKGHEIVIASANQSRSGRTMAERSIPMNCARIWMTIRSARLQSCARKNQVCSPLKR
mmetsp:Transcript_37415/g.94037  ORF Transcript_37415/g.94037 Transcript_37415/m.94037 type:complete len:268 (+) Transcript_37415:159-962(+)